MSFIRNWMFPFVSRVIEPPAEAATCSNQGSGPVPMNLNLNVPQRIGELGSSYSLLRGQAKVYLDSAQVVKNTYDKECTDLTAKVNQERCTPKKFEESLQKIQSTCNQLLMNLNKEAESLNEEMNAVQNKMSEIELEINALSEPYRDSMKDLYANAETEGLYLKEDIDSLKVKLKDYKVVFMKSTVE